MKNSLSESGPFRGLVILWPSLRICPVSVGEPVSKRFQTKVYCCCTPSAAPKNALWEKQSVYLLFWCLNTEGAAAAYFS